VSALPAAETAVLVVSAVSGVELNTVKSWNAARKAGLSGVIVVNKMDGDNIVVDDVLAGIREIAGISAVPFNLPAGQGANFKGVFDVFSDTATPAGLVGDAAAAHEEAMDAIVELDEALLEKYLEDGKVDAAQLAKTLAKAIGEGSLAPILFASARQEIGVAELLDIIANVAPSPSARSAWRRRARRRSR